MVQKGYIGSKYSFENPEVWVPTSEEDAEKEIPVLINLFLSGFNTPQLAAVVLNNRFV